MTVKRWLLVIILNLTIAFGFFWEQRNAGVDEISSDLANIIPVCQKIDNPELFKNDLYLSELDDVRYYTPFFVQTLRAIKHSLNVDYIQALNVLSFFTHLFYGIFWFLLFYKLKKDFWLALLFSLFVRGVLWPPGGELLGISNLWTIMPRTLHMAFLPIPFLLYVSLKKYNLFFAFLALGLIFNFHPVTGLGTVILGFVAFIAQTYFDKKLFSKEFFKSLVIAFCACLLGMLPYLLTYFGKVENDVVLDEVIFQKAFRARISSKFFDPIFFLKFWHGQLLYFFVACFALYYFFDSSIKKRNFKILFWMALSVFVLSNLSVYVEQVVNEWFGKSLRMSFQLIRFQKLILVVFQLSLFFLVVELFQRFKWNQKIKTGFFAAYLCILVLSSSKILSGVPLVSDDLTTSILPRSFHLNNNFKPDYDLNEMMKYINQNTNQESVFYGPYLIRTGAERAVVLDSKGASMLIEGNIQKLSDWYLMLQEFKTHKEPKDKIDFLRKNKVNYILDNTDFWINLPVQKQIGKYKLYHIN